MKRGDHAPGVQRVECGAISRIYGVDFWIYDVVNHTEAQRIKVFGATPTDQDQGN